MQTISKFIFREEPCMVVSYPQCYRQREPSQSKNVSPVDKACKLKPQLLICRIFPLTYRTAFISFDF